MKLILIAFVAAAAFLQADACSDMMAGCPRLAILCNHNQNVKKLCPKTCNACNTACVDMSPACPHYQMLCRINANMRKMCPKTCKSCGGPGPQPPVTVRPSGAPPPLPATCGKPAVQMQRVIAGTDAVPHSWPWQILMIKNGRAMCGGSIISAKTIVTAAHCVFQDVHNPSQFKVRVGAHDVSKHEADAVDYQVKRIIVHPGWNTRNLNNDVAMFELEKPIQFNKYVSPICLPNDDPPVGTECYITGWGKIKHPGGMHSVLQQAILPVVDNKVCHAKNFANIRIPVTSQMVCGGDGGESRKSGCHGDSGGPFVCNIGGRWELHGAVSHGSPRCMSTDTYTVFARIAYFRQWIEDYMS